MLLKWLKYSGKPGSGKGTRPPHRPRGQALAEFILVVPILLAVASLAIDMANMVFVAHRLSSAAREGARIATETTLPIPQEASTCNVNGCANSNSLCCIAVNRSNLVLFTSGVENAVINGNWFIHEANGKNYSMLEVQATTVVGFFFGIGNQTLTGTAVAYGDEFEP